MKNNKGFSLVELIVVIAIMAILAAVAVAGFSVYIPKAQQASDKQMVADIEYALTLSGYDTSAFPSDYSGYIILTQDKGAQASDEYLATILNAQFGSNWSEELSLQYDGWTDVATMLALANDNDLAGSIPGSTYITQVGTDKLLTDVQDCALALSGFLDEVTNGDVNSAITMLKDKFGEDLGAEYEAILNAAGYTAENNYAGATSDVLSNAAVFVLAKDLKADDYTSVMNGFYGGSDGNTDILLGKELTLMDEDLMPQLAAKYAAMEALVAYLDDDTCTAAFNNIEMTGDAASILASINNAGATITATVGADPDSPLAAKYAEYYMGNGTSKSQAQLDGEAYISVMQSVSDMSGDYVSSENLLKDNLFTESDMSSKLDSYASIATLKGELNPEASNLLNEIASEGYTGSAILVLVTVENGTLSYVTLPTDVAE